MTIKNAQTTDKSEQVLSDLPLPLGRSEAMRRVHDRIRRLAPTDTTTLIYGETGTGKELVATALHGLSRRGSGPYLCVNCGGLPDGLVESELFGHVRGAFTGAFPERTGRFEAAHGGTLFLDEIGDISPAVQIRLLRVLETKCVEPVGSHRARKVDVRVLAATNKPLWDEVGAGRFRRDLYYRLNLATIELPPLRQRREDIPLLARYFLDQFGRRSRRGVREIGAEATEVLMHRGWPGNVRELRNAINTRPSRLKPTCSGPPICHRSRTVVGQEGLFPSAGAAIAGAGCRRIPKEIWLPRCAAPGWMGLP